MVQSQTRDALVFTMAGKSLDHEKGSVAIMKRLKVLVSALAALAIFTGGAAADVVYTAYPGDEGYASSSMIGTVSGGNSGLLSGIPSFGSDTRVFSFKDHNDKEKILVRESYDAEDSIYIYTPGDWQGTSDKVINEKWPVYNIYGVEVFGDYLYLVTNQTGNYPDQGSGQVMRFDMTDEYKPAGSYDLKNLVDNDEGKWRCGGVAIKEFRGDIYVVTTVFDLGNPRQFEESRVLKFDNGLLQKPESGVPIGKNAVGLSGNVALDEDSGKLYIGCLGSAMGASVTDSGYWEVDLTTMQSKQIIDLNEHDALGLDGLYSGSSIAMGKDGTAFLLLLRYELPDYTPIAKLYRTNVEQLAEGDIGTEVKEAFKDKIGYSWGVIYDNINDLFWCMAGEDLIAFNKDGSQTQEFTTGRLEGRICSVAVVDPIKDAGGNGNSSGGGGGGCDAGLGGLSLLALLALRVSQASTASSKCRRG